MELRGAECGGQQQHQLVGKQRDNWNATTAFHPHSSGHKLQGRMRSFLVQRPPSAAVVESQLVQRREVRAALRVPIQ